MLAVRGGDSERTAVTQASNVPALTSASAMHTSQSIIRHDSQMVPNFSFGSATLQGCTINVYQAPVQLSQSEVKDLFEAQW